MEVNFVQRLGWSSFFPFVLVGSGSRVLVLDRLLHVCSYCRATRAVFPVFGYAVLLETHMSRHLRSDLIGCIAVVVGSG
jgi:hypothetical protein